MNQTLLQYEVEIPDLRQPFEFFVPRMTDESVGGAELVDNVLTLWITADATTPTRGYVGQLYAVGEPYERPRISIRIIVRRTIIIPERQDPRPFSDRMVLLLEPDEAEARQEVAKKLRKELGPLGDIMPPEVLGKIVDKALGTGDQSNSDDEQE